MKKPLRRAFAPIIVLCALAVFATAPRSATAADAPPYEEGLLRLSELMGSIHYLRALCGAQDGNRWRDEMEALVDAEGSSNEDRRRRLVERFNRGYRAFASVYRECTPSARKAVESYMAEGAELSAEISARYSR
ncbi:TIGR02301 family protein [Breoghania sp.]|uniref:TIGR02301 family protein n=1 Tax=Breoghania sp. TaxID=2065378 RepID=UPI002AA7479A|nr:TIGR02301 family protein [Breoghania sp.]